MKKHLSLLLALALACALLPPAAAAEEAPAAQGQTGPHIWTATPETAAVATAETAAGELPAGERNLLNPTGEETIFETIRNGDGFLMIRGVKSGHALEEAVADGILVLPDSVDDIPVVGITDHGLDATISYGGTGKTWTETAKSIHFPENLVWIGTSGCQAIGMGFEEIRVPDIVWQISNRAFEGVITERFVFPENEQYTAIRCRTLATAVARTVVIPATITQIEEGAFEHWPYSFESSDFAMQTIEYAGTIDEWGRIAIGSDNGTLTHRCVDIVCSDGTIAAQHEWSAEKEIIRPASCEEEGLKGFVCAYCKKTKDTVTVPAQGHSYDAGTVTKPATLDEEGIKTYICTVCGAEKTEAIPKLKPTQTEPPAEPEPTATPKPSIKPEPTATPEPSARPEPTATPEQPTKPVSSSEPDSTDNSEPPAASVAPSPSTVPARGTAATPTAAPSGSAASLTATASPATTASVESSATAAPSAAPSVSEPPAETAAPAASVESAVPDDAVSPAAAKPASRLPLLLVLLAVLLLAVGLGWIVIATKRRRGK